MSQIEQQQSADANVGSQRSCTRSSDDGSRSTLDSRKAELELLVIRTFHKLLLPNIETLVRKIVREETGLVQERVLTILNQNSGSKINHSEPRILQLKFLNNPGLLVWTGTKITGEDGTSLKVALVDAFTGQVVSSGPEASARVEIGVVHVNSDGAEEFNQHTLLLSGDTRVNLKDGVVSVGKISFPHKKKYAKKCQLMLGARIVGNFGGAGVQEAKSEPFILDDRRNALYKKHYPPSLPDEVWRLKNIGRGGSFDKRLSQKNIKTVEEFLTLYFTDCEGLQEGKGKISHPRVMADLKKQYRSPTLLMVLNEQYRSLVLWPRNSKDVVVKVFQLGHPLHSFKHLVAANPAHLDSSLILGSNMTDKMLKDIVDHGLTCKLDKRYVYHLPGSTKGVVFNVVGQAVGVVSESHYVPIGNLSEEEKGDAQKLVVSAFKPGVELVPYDECCLLSSSSLSVNEPSSSNASLPKCCSFNRYVCSPNGSALTSEEAYNVVGQTVGVFPENASICDLSGIETGVGQKLSVLVSRHGKELDVHDEMNLPESSTNLASSNSEVMEESFSFGNNVSCTFFMENDTSSSRSFARMDSLEEMSKSCDMDFLRDFMRCCDCDDEAASPRTMSIAVQKFAREMLMKIRKPGHVPKRQKVN